MSALAKAAAGSRQRVDSSAQKTATMRGRGKAGMGAEKLGEGVWIV